MSGNKEPPRKRRLTPSDDPSVIIRWRQRETELLESGYSRHRAHLKIAEEANTSMSVVYSYLTYGASRKQQTSRSYEIQKRHPAHLPKHAFRNRFARSPARYIAPLYRQPDEAISLEELSLRLKEKEDYLPRMPTLERIANEGHPRTKEPILTQVSPGPPPLYRLFEGLYDRYGK